MPFAGLMVEETQLEHVEPALSSVSSSGLIISSVMSRISISIMERGQRWLLVAGRRLDYSFTVVYRRAINSDSLDVPYTYCSSTKRNLQKDGTKDGPEQSVN